MRNVHDILDEIDQLPEKDRRFILERLQEKSEPSVAEIEAEWAEVANQRLDEMLSGEIKGIAIEEMREKYGKHYEE